MLSFDKVNKIITVLSPDTEITIQNLLNSIREFEDELTSLDIPKIASCAGKEPLGGGVVVGLTLTLLDDWQLAFEARSGPTYIQCKVSGGNIVATNTNGPIYPTAFTQVLITASSSATQSDLAAIQYSSFGGGVSIDITNANTGTDYPMGSQEYPVNNIPDAVTIANERGFIVAFIRSSMSIEAVDISEFKLVGLSHVNTVITIADSAVCSGITIENANVVGILDGKTHLVDCSVGDITYVNGHIHHCGLYGNIILGGDEDAVIESCFTVDIDNYPTIDMGVSGQDLAMPNYSGIIQVSNFNDPTGEIGIGLVSGKVVLDSTITQGSVIISGIALLEDNTAEAVTVNTEGLMNKATIAETISESYIHRIYIDVVNGTAGTTAPLGNEKHPVNNLPDAITIAVRENIDRLDISGSLTITTGQDISGYTLISDRSLGNVVTVDSGATTSGTYFENLTISGTMSGSVRYTTCVLGVIDNFDGGAKNSLLVGDITFTGTGNNYLTECDTYVTSSAYISLYQNDASLNIIRGRGRWGIFDKSSTDVTAIDLVAGFIYVDVSCNVGEIHVSGIGSVEDDSGTGCTVRQGAINNEYISSAIWDELLTANTHNLPGTAGRRMRTLTSMVIRNENAQGPGIGNNQIQFDSEASALDGAYDPALVSIIAGTGIGQTRLILQYEGSTLTATVDRNWRVNPDATSEYIIISDAGREHVNEGLAQAGTLNTITLNTSASPNDNAYKGQVVFIRSGTAEDQARRVLAYDGTTKIATMGSDWSVTPDTASAYVVLPTGTITHKMIEDAVLDAEVASHTISGSLSTQLIKTDKKVGGLY